MIGRWPFGNCGGTKSIGEIKCIGGIKSMGGMKCIAVFIVILLSTDCQFDVCITTDANTKYCIVVLIFVDAYEANRLRLRGYVFEATITWLRLQYCNPA